LGVSLSLEYEEGVAVDGITTAIDRLKFSQVISNLFENALKFTPTGGNIRVSVAVTHDPDRVRIDVSDTGIGISQVHSGIVLIVPVIDDYFIWCRKRCTVCLVVWFNLHLARCNLGKGRDGDFTVSVTIKNMKIISLFIYETLVFTWLTCFLYVRSM